MTDFALPNPITTEVKALDLSGFPTPPPSPKDALTMKSVREASTQVITEFMDGIFQDLEKSQAQVFELSLELAATKKVLEQKMKLEDAGDSRKAIRAVFDIVWSSEFGPETFHGIRKRMKQELGL